MKSCIVYKCIKPEGSEDSRTFRGTKVGFTQGSREGGDRRQLQHHVYVTEMEPRFPKQLRSSDYITLAPNLDYLGNGKCEN